MVSLILLGSGCSAPTAVPVENPPVILAATLANPTARSTTSAPTRTNSTSSSATPASTQAPAQTLTPTANALALPEITLKKGDFYFTTGGSQSFFFVRNMAGTQMLEYFQLLDLAKNSGTKIVRIQLDSMGMGYTQTGELDAFWAKKWEQVFARAAQNGISVLPVFAGWFDWNNGDPDYGYSTWKSNPFNAANNGPAQTPGELFQAGSPIQETWLAWLKTLVERWQGQQNIVAWEIFSEVNIASGVNEAAGVDFVQKAAAVIRGADPLQRPVTASLAETGEWQSFYRSQAIDFINLHPYPSSGQLDTFIIQKVREYQRKYQKPVFIGESGLSASPPGDISATLTTAKNARLGIEHAIWAALVSGAMNGRALYWEDSFAIFFPGLSWNFILQYAGAENPAARFASGVDFSGFQPVQAQSSAKILGAALGNEKTILGWFRDAGCEPPDWPLQPVISKQTVSVNAPGAASTWQVDFYDTATGEQLPGSITVQPQGNTLTISLPDFSDAIAFKLTAK